MKFRRIFAFAGAMVLAGLFITAIVLAVTGAPANHLMAVLFSIVFITAVLYAMGLTLKALKKPSEDDSENGGNKAGKPASAPHPPHS